MWKLHQIQNHVANTLTYGCMDVVKCEFRFILYFCWFRLNEVIIRVRGDLFSEECTKIIWLSKVFYFQSNEWKGVRDLCAKFLLCNQGKLDFVAVKCCILYFGGKKRNLIKLNEKLNFKYVSNSINI